MRNRTYGAVGGDGLYPVTYPIAMKNFVHANVLKLEEIGERIRLRRKKLKYTLEDIEKATGISRKTLIKLEKGGDVRFSTLTTVLSILGLTLDWSDQTKYMFSDRLGDRNDGWY